MAAKEPFFNDDCFKGGVLNPDASLSPRIIHSLKLSGMPCRGGVAAIGERGGESAI